MRSTDGSQKVGCVVVSANLERVLGVGYNGGAAGMNDREFIPADRSGYVRAEENAPLKAGAIEKDKVMFLTHTPRVMCANTGTRTLTDVRRIVLTWLWATRGGRVDLTVPLPT